MWSVRDEVRKHRAFREAWVGYLLGAAYLLFNLRQYWRYGFPSSWFEIQQDIYCYGNLLTAFLIVMGLPRLICCEQEYGTVNTIRVSERGIFLVWRSKALFTIVYCAAVVAVIGVVSLLFHGGFIGFRDALGSVAETAAFGSGPLPLSNLAYCALQYVFLFLGAVYFAGFVLLVAQITQRTTFTIFLCGGVILPFSAALWWAASPCRKFRRRLLGSACPSCCCKASTSRDSWPSRIFRICLSASGMISGSRWCWSFC